MPQPQPMVAPEQMYADLNRQECHNSLREGVMAQRQRAAEAARGKWNATQKETVPPDQPVNYLEQPSPANPEVTARQYNRKLYDHWISTWLKNAALNYASFPFAQADRCQNCGKTVPGAAYINGVQQLMLTEHGPCVIAGAGPSLDRNLKDLLKCDPIPPVFCSISNLRPFLAHGIKPAYVMAYDAGHGLARYIIDPPGMVEKTADLHLIAATTTSPELLAMWRGRITWFNCYDDSGGDYFWFLTHALPIFFPNVGTLPNTGCVLTAQMMMAAHLGYKPLLLVGADLSYPDMVSRCTDYKPVKGQWVAVPPPPERIPPKQLLVDYKGIKTRGTDMNYKAGLENRVEVLRREGAMVYNCSGSGIVEIQNCSIKEALSYGINI